MEASSNEDADSGPVRFPSARGFVQENGESMIPAHAGTSARFVHNDRPPGAQELPRRSHAGQHLIRNAFLPSAGLHALAAQFGPSEEKAAGAPFRVSVAACNLRRRPE